MKKNPRGSGGGGPEGLKGSGGSGSRGQLQKSRVLRFLRLWRFWVQNLRLRVSLCSGVPPSHFLAVKIVIIYKFIKVNDPKSPFLVILRSYRPLIEVRSCI